MEPIPKYNPPSSSKFTPVLPKIELLIAGLFIGVVSTFAFFQHRIISRNSPIKNTVYDYSPTPTLAPFPTPAGIPDLNRLFVTNNGTLNTYTLKSPIYIKFNLPDNYEIDQTDNSGNFLNSVDINKKNCEPANECHLASIEWKKIISSKTIVEWDGSSREMVLDNDTVVRSILANYSVSQCNEIYPEGFVPTLLYGKKVWTGSAKNDLCRGTPQLTITAFIDTITKGHDKYFIIVWPLDKSPETGILLNSLKYGPTSE